jgi:hypothetical protein
MSDSALLFVSSRQNPVVITRKRVEDIVWYSVECYKLLLNDAPIYSKKYVKENTTYSFEDYLKMEFVDNYLIKNKGLFTSKISDLEEINFEYEPVKRYTDMNGIEKSDKIDIYINKIGLKNYLNTEDEHAYFVFECKRISRLSDTAAYINDIQKFADRKHKVRLPFEGMIAFIESINLSEAQLADEINKRLKVSYNIKTSQYLTALGIYKDFTGRYDSTHKKNYDVKEKFSVFHLLFDYSNYVTN